MFTDTSLAKRIERAEAQMMHSVTKAVSASGRAPSAFALVLGAGVATYVRPGSPLNKLAGMGLDAPIEEVALTSIEAAMGARAEPVRVELATLANREAAARLTARGYQLVGFENVLARPLLARKSTPTPTPGVRIERMNAATRAAWQETTVTAVAAADATGVVVDPLSRQTIEDAIADVLEADSLDRYVAYLDGVLAGAASLWVHEGIAVLGGSATLPELRRRGLHSALIAARLDDAYARGAELAIITTAPGSQSQANVMKHGFALAYSRAILVGS